jgi:hypothetical protein
MNHEKKNPANASRDRAGLMDGRAGARVGIGLAKSPASCTARSAMSSMAVNKSLLVVIIFPSIATNQMKAEIEFGPTDEHKFLALVTYARIATDRCGFRGNAILRRG